MNEEGGKVMSLRLIASQQSTNVVPLHSGQPERPLVYGYLCVEEDDPTQVLAWNREIAAFCMASGYHLGSIFFDRTTATCNCTRNGFIELLAALRLLGVYGVVVPSLAHLSSDSFTQQVLIHMVQLTDSQLLVSARSNASSPTVLSAEARSKS